MSRHLYALSRHTARQSSTGDIYRLRFITVIVMVNNESKHDSI